MKTQKVEKTERGKDSKDRKTKSTIELWISDDYLIPNDTFILEIRS